MSGAPRLVCRLRGHVDAVVVVHAGVGAAVLHCDRCERRKIVPFRGGAAVPTRAEPAASPGIVAVDLGALQLLQLGAQVDASYSELLRLLLDEDT